jgi:disulfide oxidoreductase YuzD
MEDILMMAKDFVVVKVFDLVTGGGCCVSCAASPDYVNMLQQKLGELETELETNYPGRTKLEYIDLNQAPEKKGSEAAQLVVTGKYPAPLLVIDDEPKFAGYIDVKKIIKEVGIILR